MSDGSAAALVDVPPARFGDALRVLRLGFGPQVDRFAITVENDPGYPAFWEVGDVARAVSRPAQLFAVRQDGDLIGCAFLCPSRRRPDEWQLRHLTVLPEARHHGHGERLVREGVRRAAAYDARVVRIGIIAENLELSRWYQRLGFVTVSPGNLYPPLPFAVDHLEFAVSQP